MYQPVVDNVIFAIASPVRIVDDVAIASVEFSLLVDRDGH